MNNNTRDNYNPIVPAKIVVSLCDRERSGTKLLSAAFDFAGLFAIFCGKEKYLKYPFHK